jgi:hypothetical protein
MMDTSETDEMKAWLFYPYGIDDEWPEYNNRGDVVEEIIKGGLTGK